LDAQNQLDQLQLQQALPTISCTTVAWHLNYFSIRARDAIQGIAIVISKLLQASKKEKAS